MRTALRLALMCGVFCSFTMFENGTAFAAIGIDAKVVKNQSSPSTSVTTTAFSTAAPNELLLAFISADSTASPNTIVTSVTGGGLNWALAQRTNVQKGTAEVWRAFSPVTLSNVTVKAALSQSVVSSMTVMSFTGVNTSGTSGSGAIGAVGTGYGNPGAPTATLQTQGSGSIVVGVGSDWDNAINRSLGPNQTLLNQYLAPVGDTYWVQMQTSAIPLNGTSVTINDVAPTTDRYNLSIVEILASGAVASTSNIIGTVTPAAIGQGTIVTLSQNGTAIATATVDSSGAYKFPNQPNGTYSLQASKTGYSISPASQTAVVNNADVNVPAFTSVALTWTVSGLITGDNGNATVTLSQSGTTIGSAITGTAGNYQFQNVATGNYLVTPSKTGATFNPPTQSISVTANTTVQNFVEQTSAVTLLYPDLRDIIPTGKMSVVQTSSGRQFQYTHDTLNHGPGPLVIQPALNTASGAYQGTQYIYSQNSSGTWTLAQQIPVAGAFIFDSDHSHFHFPFVTYGLYTVGANGGPGAAVAVSAKVSFCIVDSFLYEPNIPNAGALGNLGSCTDPTSLRGLDIGAVDEYDQSDAGQAISIGNLPDGTYWLRALVDPNNFLAEADKTNNETDVELTITGTTVQVLQTVIPVLNSPPTITMTSPTNAGTVSGTVQLAASTAMSSGVQFLVDGQNFGSIVTGTSYTVSWDTTTVPNGVHWLAAQTTDPTGIIGTSPVVQVTVSNNPSPGPIVQLASPANGSILDSTTTLYATVADSQPISNVVFNVDYVPVGSVTSAPYMIQWNSTTVPDGQHVLTVTATDAVGNVGNSAPVTLTVNNSHPANLIGEDAKLSVDGAGTLTTTQFSTATAGDLLVAFVSFDGPSGSPQTASVSGAGLTWTLLMRSNTQHGTSEIWSTRADGTLSNVTVTALAQSGNTYHGSLTVIAFTNAYGTSVVGRTGAPSGAPDISLPGVISGDWVFAVGNDWDNAIGRSPVAGQVLVHQKVDTSVGDTYWVQSTTAPTTANTLVDIHDSAPTSDRWNYAAVEIVATHQ